MQVDEHISALRREGDLFITAVATADLDAVPPTCPDWTVRDLAHHLGQVHRWAANYVATARPTMTSPEEDQVTWGPPPADRQLLSWLREGHSHLVTALEGAPADLQCWSFLAAPSPLAFWARRQAHETAIHRVDAQSTRPPAQEVPTAFAIDGIEELLLCFFSRPRNRLRAPEERSLAIVATDADASWTVIIGPEGARADRGTTGEADAKLAGTAAALYVFLWNRRPLGDLQIFGDPGLVELWQEKARIVWS